MDTATHTAFPLVLVISVVIADLSIFLDLPVYRQIFGFLLVTFIPGLLITHILNLKFTSPSKTILYSVGFSVTLTMFLGFIVNLIGPLFGIYRPLSAVPLLVAINIVILVLLITSFIGNPLGYKSPIDFKDSLAFLRSPQVLFLFLTLLLGVAGGIAVQYYICSLFSVIAMFLIATAAALIAFDKFFEAKHYTMILFVIGLTLLLVRTLTSPYLANTDIHVELFYQKLTEINAYWDPNVYPGTCNTMLSTVILPNVYSVLLGIDTILVYKVVFSILFALVPVALYHVFKGSLKPQFSFFSVFLFLSFYAYSMVLTWLPRQQVAELYLALMLLTLFEKEIRPSVRGFLTVAWISSIVVSHYATTYITLFFMILVTIMLFIFRERAVSIKLSTTVFAVILTVSWYIYISLSKTFESIVNIGRRISIAMGDELFSSHAIDPTVSKALGSGLLDQPFWHALGHIWQYGTQVLLVIGFVYIFLRYMKKRSQPELTFFSAVGMLFLFMSITLPYFASSLNMDRIYHIVLIFISPLCVIGLLYLIESFSSICNLTAPQKQKVISICLMLVFVPYFLFNSSAVFEVTENSNNFALKIDQTKDYSKYYSNATYFFLNQRVPGEDVVACDWISTFRTADSPIYSDCYRECELWGYGLISFNNVFGRVYPPSTGGYVFVGRQNIIDNVYISPDKARVHSSVKYDFEQIQSHLDPRDLIYSSGALIYK